MNITVKKAKTNKTTRRKWKCNFPNLELPLKLLAGILVVTTALIRLAEVIRDFFS